MIKEIIYSVIFVFIAVAILYLIDHYLKGVYISFLGNHLTYVIAMFGLILGYFRLVAIQESINLSKIDTVIKIEQWLTDISRKRIELREQYAYYDGKESQEVKKRKKLEVDSLDLEYLNMLDKLCLFILTAGNRFVKEMKPEYNQWLKSNMDDKETKELIYKTKYSNILKLYEKWNRSKYSFLNFSYLHSFYQSSYQ